MVNQETGSVSQNSDWYAAMRGSMRNAIVDYVPLPDTPEPVETVREAIDEGLNSEEELEDDESRLLLHSGVLGGGAFDGGTAVLSPHSARSPARSPGAQLRSPGANAGSPGTAG